MMRKPLIGLAADRAGTKYRFKQAQLSEAYTQAVIESGGIPVLIPVGIAPADYPALLAGLDGLLLTGGGDVDPKFYNGSFHPKVNGVEVDRDSQELALVHQAVKLNLPFMGICRGMQLINVALGGTLYTHVLTQLDGAMQHKWSSDYPRDYLAHMVRIEKESHLYKIIGETQIEVNSLHHQGVQRIAPPLKPVGFAPDGLVEALELPEHRFGIAVQWHPEWLMNLPHARALFLAFIEATAGANKHS